MQSAHEYMKKWIMEAGPGGLEIMPKLEDLPSDLLSRVRQMNKFPERKIWAYSSLMNNGKWQTEEDVTLEDAVIKGLLSAKLGNRVRIGPMLLIRGKERNQANTARRDKWAAAGLQADTPPDRDWKDEPNAVEMVELGQDLSEYFEKEAKRMHSLGVLQRQPKEQPPIT